MELEVAPLPNCHGMSQLHGSEASVFKQGISLRFEEYLNPPISLRFRSVKRKKEKVLAGGLGYEQPHSYSPWITDF